MVEQQDTESERMGVSTLSPRKQRREIAMKGRL